jgi:4-amino-4-deoxy-L-arabinose transferase-like glycosyltransferase
VNLALGLSTVLTRKGKSPPLLRAAVVAVWLGSGAAYLTVPPSPDQFEFDYMGWRMLEGDVPYRDFVDMNFPGGYWLHALSTALFGHQLWSWRALDFLLLIASAWPLARLVESAGGRAARRALLVLYPLLYASLPQWIAGQTDTTGGQLLIGCLACHAAAYASGRVRLELATGALLTAAVLNKPTLGLLGVLLPIPALLAGHSWKVVLRHTLTAAGGSIGTLVLAVAFLLLQGTTGGDLYEAVYLYNTSTQFQEVTPLPRMLSTFGEVHFVWWHFVSAFGLATGAWLVVRARRSLPAMSLVMLWLAGAGSFFVQAKWFQYHLAACFLALVGLLCAGIGLLLEARWSIARNGAPALAALLVSLLGTGKKLQANYETLPAALSSGDFREHYSQFQEGESLTVTDALGLVEVVRSMVPAGETAYVFGSASSINFLARRAQPTRFFYAPVIKNSVPPLPMAAKWLKLYADDLTTRKPRLCVLERVDQNWLDEPTPPARVLRDFLATQYRPVASPTPNTPYLLYARR